MESPGVGLTVTDLERGGKLVDWDGFVMQIGAYPETIKDTLAKSGGVPQLFLVPEHMFDAELGVSAAELEFPLYFNFYIKSRPLRFICRRPQLRSVWRVLKEAVFGPSFLDHEREYAQGRETPGFPDLRKEMAYYKADSGRPRGRLRLRDTTVPYVFNEAGQVKIGEVTVTALGGDHYQLEKGSQTEVVAFEPRLPPVLIEAEGAPFVPPRFGVTTIGSGHGFDASSNTSGFLVWINGRGLLVDPPVDSTEWLRRNHIPGRLIEDVILTHTHADHDSGTLQKILEEGRIRLHTTPTVLRGFLRKYRSLTGLSSEELSSLFDFKPVLIGQGVNIAGGEFRFRYNLHPIPTLGFEVHYRGKTFAYSCDTLYDPEQFEQLREAGVLSRSRMEDLLNFNWEADLIIHEAGIPPIHTPMKVLAALPEEVKSRLYLTHVSQSAIPEGSGLRLAPPGPASTMRLEVTKPSLSDAEERLDLLAHLDLFSTMPIGRAVEFLRITSFSRHQAGETVVRQGGPGDRFYMILSGEVDVIRDGQWLMRYGRYDYFGEIAVVLDQPRAAEVVARTGLELLSISRVDFLSFIQNTDLEPILRLVAHNKLQGGSAILDQNRYLGSLSPFQKTQLLADMRRRTLESGERLFSAGERAANFYVVSEGQVHLEGPDRHEAWLGRGALLGQLAHYMGACSYSSTATATLPSTLYSISAHDMEHFFRRNPGTYVRILRLLAPPTPSYLR